MTNSSAATVFLIDDHPAVRQGLALLLTQAGHRVCGEAGNHAETRAFLAGGQSDIAILDLHLGPEAGFPLIGELSRHGIPVLVYSMFEDMPSIREVFDCGAMGYVCKREVAGELTRAVLLRKWTSRVHTLLVPYVLWNLLILCLWAFAQWLPATSGILPTAGKRVADFGAWDYANALFGMTGYPIAYQLWFIRDLMLLMLMAPLLQLASKRVPNLVSLVLLLAWLTETWPLGIPAAEGVVFFYAGVRLALSPGAPERLDRFAPPFLFLYAGYLIAFAWLPARMSAHAWGMFGLVLGGAAVIFLTRALVRHARIRRSLACPAGLVFFLFAAHEPLLTIVKKGAYLYLGEAPEGVLMLARLGVTLLVAALCAAGYRIMGRLAPRLLRVLTGNR